MTDISVTSKKISSPRGLLSNDKNDAIKKAPIEVTYKNLVFENRSYRLLFVAWLFGELAEWFTYVAAISLIKRILGNPDADKTAVSVLVAVWLLPTVIFSNIGGIIADSRDRRWSMMELDLAGGIVALLYLIGSEYQSIGIVYVVSFVKQSVAALYEPCGYAILPMIVAEEEYLKKAITLYSFGESVMSTLGPFLGGIGVATFGIEACFVIDSVLYVSGAYLTWMVGGTWDPGDEESSEAESDGENERGSESEPSLLYTAGGTWDTEDTGGPTREEYESQSESSSDEDPDETLWEKYIHMTTDGVRYLQSSFFGPLLLLKFSAAAIFGSLDVLEVSFSEQSENEQSNSLRLGLLFAFSGVGTIVGTSITEYCTDAKDSRSLQSACVWSYLFMSMSLTGMALFPSFASPCVFTIFESAGATLLWIISDLLLQKFCAPKMLGRVVALDSVLATLSEATSAVLAGVMQDRLGLSARSICLVMAVIGLVMFGLWSRYHRLGLGAASAQAQVFKSSYIKTKKRDGTEELSPLIVS